MIFRALFFKHNTEVGRDKRRLRKAILQGSLKYDGLIKNNSQPERWISKNTDIQGAVVWTGRNYT